MSHESPSGPYAIAPNVPSSPPYMRLPSSGRQHEEELINAYEAEEERILNTLSRKLEQVKTCSLLPFTRTTDNSFLFLRRRRKRG